MRVIAGSAKGMKLKAPRGAAVRPTADRVKEALFSILGPRLVGTNFIDLYAGSGAIGIEALSRGADFCIFVDNRKENLVIIRQNLYKTRLSEKARLILSDVEKALPLLAEEKISAELIYIDPPYSASNIHLIVGTILNANLLTKRGLLIIEHVYSNRQWAEEFDILKQKRYGDACLTIIAADD